MIRPGNADAWAASIAGNYLFNDVCKLARSVLETPWSRDYLSLTCDSHSHLAFDIILPPEIGTLLLGRLPDSGEPVRCHHFVTLPPFSPVPERGPLSGIAPFHRSWATYQQTLHNTDPTESNLRIWFITLFRIMVQP